MMQVIEFMTLNIGHGQQDLWLDKRHIVRNIEHRA